MSGRHGPSEEPRDGQAAPRAGRARAPLAEDILLSSGRAVPIGPVCGPREKNCLNGFKRENGVLSFLLDNDTVAFTTKSLYVEARLAFPVLVWGCH